MQQIAIFERCRLMYDCHGPAMIRKFLKDANGIVPNNIAIGRPGTIEENVEFINGETWISFSLKRSKP